MVKNIQITPIHTDTLCCEPLLERTASGELLCVCQCDGPEEPHPENREYAFHSKDNGKTWSHKERIYPEDGQAVYGTELTVDGDEITAYLTLHSGLFLDWKCCRMKSFDNGYTWEKHDPLPHFPAYTFMRARLKTSDGRFLLPYQTYPVTEEEHERVKKEAPIKIICATKTPYCESGVLETTDGIHYERYVASRMDMQGDWIWSEPTLAELSDGTIAMLLRYHGDKYVGGGFLYRCDSKDGGKTWSPVVRTDIPNPSNKPRLFPLKNGKIALIHTPHPSDRFPLELWISDDDMHSWGEKVRLTDTPGSYSYTDGFYEDGHIRFVIERDRQTILYFDVTLEE